MSDDLYVAAERVAGRIADGDFAGGKKLLREVFASFERQKCSERLRLDAAGLAEVFRTNRTGRISKGVDNDTLLSVLRKRLEHHDIMRLIRILPSNDDYCGVLERLCCSVTSERTELSAPLRRYYTLLLREVFTDLVLFELKAQL